MGPEIDEVPALVLLPPELPVVLEFDVMVGPCGLGNKGGRDLTGAGGIDGILHRAGQHDIAVERIDLDVRARDDAADELAQGGKVAIDR